MSSRSSVLRLIHESGGMAAAEISRQTGLGTVAVKRHVDYLLKAGKIRKAGMLPYHDGCPVSHVVVPETAARPHG